MKTFSRRIEDFTCDVCGAFVTGNGYTNHCPKCLCSKHVDINPGDRAAACRGIMRPVGLELKKGGQCLIHRCELCGHTRKNKVSADDDFDMILYVASDGQCTRTRK